MTFKNFFLAIFVTTPQKSPKNATVDPFRVPGRSQYFNPLKFGLFRDDFWKKIKILDIAILGIAVWKIWVYLAFLLNNSTVG